MRSLFIAALLLLSASAAFSRPQQSAPDTVRVGAYVMSVHDINFHDKEYTIRFWLWFVYDNPDFDFSKQLDIPNAKEIESEIIVDSLDGKAWAMMKMKCVMKENWGVLDFPFDNQHLRVQIENTIFDQRRLVFVPDTSGSTFDKKEAIDGWVIREFNIESGKNKYETGFGDLSTPNQVFSTFLIHLELQREAWGLFAKIFIGMYIAFLIAVISFTLHPSEMEPRFGLPVGGLFAAVGNKYIIDSILPESSDFTLVDTLHATTFFAIFGTLVVSSIALRLHDRGKKEACLEVNRKGGALVIVAYMIVNMVSIYLAII